MTKEQSPTPHCRYCGGGSVNLREHEENCVIRQDFDCHYDGDWNTCDKDMCRREKQCRRRTAAPSAIAPSLEPVAWANWKVGTTSYVPRRTREEAEKSVEQSRISAPQDGEYEVVPLFAAQSTVAAHMPSRERLREKIAADPDLPAEVAAPLEGKTPTTDALLASMQEETERTDGEQRLLALATTHSAQWCEHARSLEQKLAAQKQIAFDHEMAFKSAQAQLTKAMRIISRCHEAVGENVSSDHESLPGAIATHIRERDQRIKELEALQTEKTDTKPVETDPAPTTGPQGLGSPRGCEAPIAAQEPAASSRCPICGADTPHAHNDSEIHRWLESQAARFGLTVSVCNKSDVETRKAFRFSEEEAEIGRNAFEAWFGPRTAHLSHYKLHRSDVASDQYISITTQECWDIWRAAWEASAVSLRSSTRAIDDSALDAAVTAYHSYLTPGRQYVADWDERCKNFRDAMRAAIAKALPSATAAPSDDLPLKCQAVGGVLDMRVGEKVLAFAANNCPALWDGEADRGRYRVTGPAAFAKVVEHELNHEAEDGSTRLTRMLDDAIEEAINQGAEGIEEVGPIDRTAKPAR